MDHANAEAPPNTLLFHDGELGDVRTLLGTLGAPFVERRGRLLPEDASENWGVIVSTPQRILDAHPADSAAKPTQIAIVDRDSRTLRNSLRRAGIQLMVRRPVHPAALRALILHALYRGPERRRTTRISIGAPVRFRSGWRQRPAILADLSLGGCRLISAHDVEPGKSITLCVPAEVGAGKAFQLKAEVLRRLGGSGPETAFTAKFRQLKPKEAEHLKRTLKAHIGGPASINVEGDPAQVAEPETDAGSPPEAIAAPPPPPAREVVRAAAIPRAVPVAPAAPAAPEPEASSSDRRNHARHSMDRRVIALGEQASRVLMGRDISLGGMRVNPNPLLSIGDDVRLAIHVGDRDVPLIVVAKVHRDDGERGVVLRFHELDRETQTLLDRMLETLPVIEPGESESELDAGMIVSEILDDAPGTAV